MFFFVVVVGGGGGVVLFFCFLGCFLILFFCFVLLCFLFVCLFGFVLMLAVPSWEFFCLVVFCCCFFFSDTWLRNATRNHLKYYLAFLSREIPTK